MTLIDYFLKKVWLYTLKCKRKCFEKFKEFKVLVEMQLEHKIKVFWLDNGREYNSDKAFERFLKDHNIKKQTSVLYRLQQNGVAEHAHCPIVEMTRNIFHAQNLYKLFCAEMVANV
jgi:hypothetical protein